SACRASIATTSPSSKRGWRSTTRSTAGRGTDTTRVTTGPRDGAHEARRNALAGLRPHRPSLLRRAGRADRADAPRARRAALLAERAGVPAGALVLHAPAGTGGDAACDLRRLAAGGHPRRAPRGRALRPARGRGRARPRRTLCRLRHAAGRRRALPR